MKKNKNHKQIQQGDVCLTKLASFPSGEKKVVAKRRCVLAEGEATGHAHVLEDEDAELIQIGERMLLSLQKAGTVVHQEHGAVTLEKGIWEIERVLEHDYFADMTRKVQD